MKAGYNKEFKQYIVVKR